MSKPTFTIEQVKKFTVKDYEKADGDGNISYLMHRLLYEKYFKNNSLHEYFLLDSTADNRQRFKAHWGQHNFCYRSEFFYRGWVFRVKAQDDGQEPKEATYIVMTAKGKGTVYERTGGLKLLSSEICPYDQAFINWMEKELSHMPICV